MARSTRRGGTSARVALVTGLVLLGAQACTLPPIGFRGSDSCATAPEAALTTRLSTDAVLDLAPRPAELGAKYAKSACEDEDDRGQVGRPILFQGTEPEVRDHYRAELPGHGWELVTEAPTTRRGDGPDTSGAGLCFRNPAVPDATLKVAFGPTSDDFGTWPQLSDPTHYFLTFETGTTGNSCDD